MDKEFSKEKKIEKPLHKQAELLRIAKEIEQCDVCKKGTSGKAVPGEGNPDAKVVFVGEAPGKKEATTGRPFVGRSGQLLRRLIVDIGLNIDDVFITSIGKYMPRKGAPSTSQIAHSRAHVFRQVAVIGPRVVVLLGSVALRGLLQQTKLVKNIHGSVIEKDGQMYFVTVHPAAALRFPNFRHMLFDDFMVLEALLRKNHI